MAQSNPFPGGSSIPQSKYPQTSTRSAPASDFSVRGPGCGVVRAVSMSICALHLNGPVYRFPPGAPSPLSQVGSPGVYSRAGSSLYADSPSPMPSGHARWPAQPHSAGRQSMDAVSPGGGFSTWQPASATRDGGATWPPPAAPMYVDGALQEPTSPRVAAPSGDADEAETPSPRSPGDATRWLLQLSAGRGS